jgi:hypothetical protein
METEQRPGESKHKAFRTGGPTRPSSPTGMSGGASAALSTPDAPVPVRRSWSAGRILLSSGIRSGGQRPSWGNGPSMRFLSAMTGDSRRGSTRVSGAGSEENSRETT